MTPWREVEKQRLFRALGEYVVSFSHLLGALETVTASLLMPHEAPYTERQNFRAALARLTAQPIADRYFAAWERCWGPKTTNESKGVLRALRVEVNEAVFERNRIVHDLWMLSGQDGEAHLVRLRHLETHGGSEVTQTARYAADFEERINDNLRLARLVNDLAAIHLLDNFDPPDFAAMTVRRNEKLYRPSPA